MSLYSIQIDDFRGIHKLTLEDFKTINLFVGKNNCGKTSVLEAIFLAIGTSNPNLAILIDNLRGLIHDQSDDFNFIFHKLNPSNTVSLKTQFVSPIQYRNLSIKPIYRSYKNDQNVDKSETQSSTTVGTASKITGLSFSFLIKSVKQSSGYSYVSTVELTQGPPKFTFAKQYSESLKGVYLNPKNIGKDIHEKLDKIIQNKQLDKILQTLRLIDSRISNLSLGAKNMIYFDIGIEKLIPIQLMGDGISRILSILITLANTQNGIVLIDEIENGFHVNTLKILWDVIKEGAKTYNVQVFSTTHSMECVTMFSNSLNSELGLEDIGRLYRLEKDLGDIFTVYKYDPLILKSAIENNWEVR